MLERAKKNLQKIGTAIYEKRTYIIGTALTMLGGAVFINGVASYNYGKGFLEGEEHASKLIGNSKTPMNW